MFLLPIQWLIIFKNLLPYLWMAYCISQDSPTPARQCKPNELLGIILKHIPFFSHPIFRLTPVKTGVHMGTEQRWQVMAKPSLHPKEFCQSPHKWIAWKRTTFLIPHPAYSSWPHSGSWRPKSHSWICVCLHDFDLCLGP